MEDKAKTDLIAATAQIVAAYVAKNAVQDLQALIRQVHGTLAALGDEKAQGNAQGAALHPAVPIKNSVLPDCIICLEDGKKLKMLKRYLKATYNMTPAQYREKWGLPNDYPMTAPNYAKKRSHLAKASGLGQKQSTPE